MCNNVLTNLVQLLFTFFEVTVEVLRSLAYVYILVFNILIDKNNLKFCSIKSYRI